MDDDAIGSLSLAAVADDCVVVESVMEGGSAEFESFEEASLSRI